MSVIGPRPGLWNQDILTAERDKYNATIRTYSFELWKTEVRSLEAK